MKGFGIYVKNDLLEPKHFKAIGQALWLYLWILDKMTSVSEDGIGKVLHGVPIKFEAVEKDLPMGRRSYTRYIRCLEGCKYITALRTPYGHVFTITKAKKIFQKKEISQKCASEPERCAKVAEEMRQSGRNKEDNTENNTILGETKVSAKKVLPLLNKKNNTVAWNKTADDFEEGSIDLDGDGMISAPKKPNTKKYPNAPAVRKIFQEVTGLNPSNWKINSTQLKACENLYTERTILKVRSALEFYQENKEKEYCPQISSPYDLDAKWTKLGEFKLKQT